MTRVPSTSGPADQWAQPEHLLSIKEAASLLNIARATVYLHIQQGDLRSLKLGRRRLIPASAVTDFIACMKDVQW
jgi:excisionase family DNA binding protein